MRILLLLGLLILGLAEARAADGWLWCAAGDSLTRHSGYEYPYVIEDPRWRRVVVGGSGGVWDVVDEQLPRVISAGATLVTLEIGTNDIVQGPKPVAMFAGVLDWTAVVRVDIDQSEDRLSGRIWSARGGAVAYVALQGTVRGDRVTLRGGDLRFTARLSADGRVLGTLRRW